MISFCVFGCTNYKYRDFGPKCEKLVSSEVFQVYSSGSSTTILFGTRTPEHDATPSINKFSVWALSASVLAVSASSLVLKTSWLTRYCAIPSVSIRRRKFCSYSPIWSFSDSYSYQDGISISSFC